MIAYEVLLIDGDMDDQLLQVLLPPEDQYDSVDHFYDELSSEVEKLGFDADLIEDHWVAEC